MKLRIRHRTLYQYSQPLVYSIHNLLLWPVDGPSQRVLDWRIDVPAPARLHTLPDALGNRSHSFTLQTAHSQTLLELAIEASGVVESRGVSVFEDPPHAPHPSFFLRSSPLAEHHPRMALWARQMVPALAHAVARGESPSDAQLLTLADAVATKVSYRKGSTQVETTALEAFDWGLGVCQDQAHVMLAVCRSLGLCARYVSGYFYADAEPDLASHAWVDVCTHPSQGRWFGIDVTHRCPTDERHVRLAVGTDYTTCPPVKGLRRGGGQERLSVTVHIDIVAD